MGFSHFRIFILFFYYKPNGYSLNKSYRSIIKSHHIYNYNYKNETLLEKSCDVANWSLYQTENS